MSLNIPRRTYADLYGQSISKKTFCESNEATSRFVILSASFESLAAERSFAALRMTKREGLVFEQQIVMSLQTVKEERAERHSLTSESRSRPARGA
jgi:hypothetical protein